MVKIAIFRVIAEQREEEWQCALKISSLHKFERSMATHLLSYLRSSEDLRSRPSDITSSLKFAIR